MKVDAQVDKDGYWEVKFGNGNYIRADKLTNHQMIHLIASSVGHTAKELVKARHLEDVQVGPPTERAEPKPEPTPPPPGPGPDDQQQQ